ncbi:small, acid-soluble spore protein L [Peribacillus sp. FSL H8-0477]
MPKHKNRGNKSRSGVPPQGNIQGDTSPKSELENKAKYSNTKR